MGVWWAVVQIQDDHTEDDWECHQDHGEHDVVDNDGHPQRRFGDLIGKQQQEDGEGEQHIDGQAHLFSCKGKCKKNQHGEIRHLEYYLIFLGGVRV